MPPATFLRETSGGTLLSVKVQPRASRNEICPPLGNELKIKVTAPPVDAAANQALIEFLAATLHCPRNRTSDVPLSNLTHLKSVFPLTYHAARISSPRFPVTS